MAKKKLNKKVAVIGSIFLVLIALAGIWYILYKLQGPQKFIQDGDAAVAAKDYETAVKQYGRAYARSKDNDMRKKSLFKLADTHILRNDWRKAMACWDKVATVDTSDTVSRIKMLDFYYDLADTGQFSVWKNVLTKSDELIALTPEEKYYLFKGRAKLELAKGGEVENRVKALDETIEVLKKALDLNPKNPDIYRYLAEAVETKGERLFAQGAIDEQNKAGKQAQKLLEKAIAIAPNDPNAYIQLLNIKVINAHDKKQSAAVESDFIALTKKFPQSPEVFASLSIYYKREPNNIDKALKAAQKAFELAPESAKYAINAADTYYRKGSLAKDDKYVQKAIDIAKNALSFADVQDTHSSREYANKMNKLSLNTFLTYRYVENILNLPSSASKEQKDALIAEAEKSSHEISQIWGSGEHPYVIATQGMITYAKGDTVEGTKQMYAAYQQLKQSDTDYKDAQLGQLSYILAIAYANSSELGATRDFLYNALQRGIYFAKPDTLLAFSQVSLQLKLYNEVVGTVDTYEKLAKPTTSSQLIRARALIGAGQVDDAQSVLEKIKGNDPNILATKLLLAQAKIDSAVQSRYDANETKKTEAIQTELDKYRDEQAKIAIELLKSEPNATQAITIACEHLITVNKINEAKDVIAGVLSRVPNNTTANYYKILLAEPDPAKLSQDRKEELSTKAAEAIPDPVTRHLTFSDYYRSKGQLDKAIIECKKALEAQPNSQRAISDLFEIALLKKDYTLAEQMASAAKKENIDLCGGQIFVARISYAKGDYKNALNLLDTVLKERPVFAVGYMLRSQTQNALGNEQLAIEDARKSIEFNPLDSTAAKNIVSILYQRNLKLGKKASAEQMAETRAAIERACALNPREWQLLSFYAEYISDIDPVRALAIRQRLQSAVPNVQNAGLLGNLATKMASDNRNASQKIALLAIAGSAYEQGYKLDPNDLVLLKGYANYFNFIGKPELATKLLSKASNKNLLWLNQIQQGQYDLAKATLDQLYKQNPKDIDVLKGLVLITPNLNDAQGLIKYSQELLSLENTPDNQLGQIKAYLQINLIEQAQKQLASFKEKNPQDNRVLILEAWLKTKKGLFTDAVALINKDLELNPEDSIGWHLKGQVDLARGNYDEAVNDFKKAKNIAPTLQIRTDLARACLRAGRGDDAINELILAIESEAGASNTYFMLEQVYGQLGKFDALNKFYTDTIKKFPDVPFWYNRAASFAISQKNFDSALSLCKKAMELSQQNDPNIPKDVQTQQARLALSNYLNIMLQKKQYDELITYASQYVDSDLAYVAFTGIADAKAALGDKAAAFGYYNKALLKAASEDAVIFNLLGKMNSTLGRDETIKWCSDQLNTSPASLPINFAMCKLRQMNNENIKALDYINKCLELAGAKSPAYRNFIDIKQAILVNLYTTTSDEKYFIDAVKLYEDFIKTSTSVEVGALNNLAFLLADRDRDIDKALTYAKKAYDVIQNDPGILDTYAFVLYKKGDYEKAAELIQTCVQLAERTNVSASPEIYEHMGMINEKLGRKSEALNAYKNALKTGDQTLSDSAKNRIKSAIETLK